MIEETQSKDHEAIELLLPWYVNETLSATEHELVADHVASCAECQQHVTLLRTMQSSVTKSAATPIVPEPPVQQFFAGFDFEQRGVGRERFLEYGFIVGLAELGTRFRWWLAACRSAACNRFDRADGIAE